MKYDGLACRQLFLGHWTSLNASITDQTLIKFIRKELIESCSAQTQYFTHSTADASKQLALWSLFHAKFWHSLLQYPATLARRTPPKCITVYTFLGTAAIARVAEL